MTTLPSVNDITALHGDAAVETLAAAAQPFRVVAVGEEHFSASGPLFLARLTEAMLEAGGVDLVALELPYSASVWLDAFVHAPSEAIALVGLPQLRDYGLLDSDLVLLDRIRQLNQARIPGDTIHVGGFDIEHDGGALRRTVLDQVMYAGAANAPEDVLALARALVEPGHEFDASRMVFQEPLSVNLVNKFVINFQDTLSAYAAGLDRRVGRRERADAILRNLTDGGWLGGHWTDDGRALVLAGKKHTATHGRLCASEMCRLRRLPPFRNQVVSIELDWYYINLSQWNDLDYEACRSALADGSFYWRRMDYWMETFKRNGWPLESNVCVGDCPSELKQLSPNSEQWTWLQSTRRLSTSGHDEFVLLPVSSIDTPGCQSLLTDSPFGGPPLSEEILPPLQPYELTVILSGPDGEAVMTSSLDLGRQEVIDLVIDDASIKGSVGFDPMKTRLVRFDLRTEVPSVVRPLRPALRPTPGGYAFFHQVLDAEHFAFIFIDGAAD